MGDRPDRRHQELRPRDGHVDHADRAARATARSRSAWSRCRRCKRWWAVRGRARSPTAGGSTCRRSTRSADAQFALERDRGVGRDRRLRAGGRARPPLLAHPRRRRRLAVHAGRRGRRRDRRPTPRRRSGTWRRSRSSSRRPAGASPASLGDGAPDRAAALRPTGSCTPRHSPRSAALGSAAYSAGPIRHPGRRYPGSA